MSATLVVVTDGRSHIYETIPSALAMLNGQITKRIIYDDSGEPENRTLLADAFPTFTIAHSPDGRLGFGGAIRFMWKWLAAWDTNEYVFWLEDDFTFNREVDMEAMCGLLGAHPSLAQVVLKRQPWNDAERDAGGIVEKNPDAFVECEWGPQKYLIHREFWSTNPCVHRRSLCERGWPDDPHSEGKFGAILREESVAAPFAFWGARDDPPWVTHIGKERVGNGY